MNLYIVSAVSVNGRVYRSFLVRSPNHVQAQHQVQYLADSEAAEGEPLYPSYCYLSTEPVEFINDIKDLG